MYISIFYVPYKAHYASCTEKMIQLKHEIRLFGINWEKKTVAIYTPL